jgi:predicted dehydrogenase
MLRIGIVGAGNMGKTHANGWSKTPSKIVGIHSAHPSSAQTLADQYQSTVYTTLDDLISDVDVVDICAPTHLHHKMVLKVAAAKKHIVCEKPLALTVPEAKELVTVCEQAGVKLLVAHVLRFFPEYANAKAVVERGDIGNVAVVRLTRCSYQPKTAVDNWFLDSEKSGGMMLDLMIHDFDYARWIAGEVVSVFARSVRARDPHAPEDYGIAILRHVNGAISNIEGAWAYPAPMFRTALEIAGDAGLIEHPAQESAPVSIHLKQMDSGQTPDVGVPGSPLFEDPYTTQIKHFYDILIGKNLQPCIIPQDGLAAVQIAQAAIESARTGRQVNIEAVR